MKTVLFALLCLCVGSTHSIGRAETGDEPGSGSVKAEPIAIGTASWYGEEHRGRLMANGKRFDPEKLTAASWFFPLESRVLVTLNSTAGPSRSVVVKITDRGPAHHFVRAGRIIDLSAAAFHELAPNRLGLVEVKVLPTR